jgi:hypothetical protein
MGSVKGSGRAYEKVTAISTQLDFTELQTWRCLVLSRSVVLAKFINPLMAIKMHM